MIRALVFDFDGLILETEEPAFVSWREIFQEHGLDLTLAEWADHIGREGARTDYVAELSRLLGRDLERTAIETRREMRKTELIAVLEVMPGVLAHVEDAKRLGLKLAIASSGSHRWVDAHLDRLGIRAHWDAIVCRDDVAAAKPAPDLYLAAAAALGVRPDEAIAYEDSPNGIRAAKGAGLYCVAVPNPLTRQLDVSGADLRLESLADISLEEVIAKAQPTT